MKLGTCDVQSSAATSAALKQHFVRNCCAFYGLGKATHERDALYIQSRLIFPSWTSRVRSPSTAF